MIQPSFAPGAEATPEQAVLCRQVLPRWVSLRSTHHTAAVLLALMISRPVAAETVTLTPAQQVDEVVITATKIERPARYITDSVTVVTEEEIERKAFTDTTEILRQTAGVQFKQAGGPGQFNYPKLRGFGSGHFLVVIDGVKVNDGLDPGVGQLLGQIDPSLIERIEVLRGPQADLYGSDTTAGVIAITTKAPLSGSNVQLGGEVGSLDWARAYGGARGTWNDFGWSVNGAAVDSGGVHAGETYSNVSPQLKLTYDPGDWLSVEASFLYTRTKFNYAELLESYAVDSVETPWWAFQLPDPDQFNEREQYLGSFRVASQITDQLRQRLLLGYTRTTNAARDDDDGLLGYVRAPHDAFTLDYFSYYDRGERLPVYDQGDDQSYHWRNENYQLDYNLILDTPFDGGENQALLGYEWFRQDAKSWGKLGDIQGNVESQAIYLSDVLTLLDGDLVLNAGLRWQDHDTYGDETTGKLGAAYTFPTSTTLFANYGTSFRAPSIRELYDPQYGNPDLGPEDGWTFETGLRQSALGGRLEAELVYWRTRLDDVIAFIGGIDPLTFEYIGTYENRDRGGSEGAELTAEWRVTDHWLANLNYTYTDAWTEEDGTRYQTTQVARNTGNLGLQYLGSHWSAGANLYYSGPRLRWAGDVEMDAYTRLDLFGRYALSPTVSVYGRIENLLDEEIEEAKGYEQPGRYLIAGIDWQFGL